MKAHQEDIKINIKVVWGWQENKSHPSKGLATYTTCQRDPWVLNTLPGFLKFRTLNWITTSDSWTTSLRERENKVLNVVNIADQFGIPESFGPFREMVVEKEKVFMFTSDLWNLHDPSFSRFPLTYMMSDFFFFLTLYFACTGERKLVGHIISCPFLCHR